MQLTRSAAEAWYASRLMRGLAMLRRRHIAILWVGECLSSLGDYFYFVAVMWTAAKLAGSAAGLVAAAESIPALAFAAAGGIIADRFDRRRAMIVADVGRALTVGVLAVCALRGALGVVPLVLAAIVLGTFDAVFTPALLASIPALVAHPGELQATNGLIDATRRIARAVGPSVAGALAAVVSTASFFLVDALSFCASGLALVAIGPAFEWKPAHEEGGRGPGGIRGMATDLGGALRAVARHEAAAWALGVLFLVNAAWAAAFQVGGVLLASRELSTGIGGYGYLVGAYGAGNVVGNLVVGSVHDRAKAGDDLRRASHPRGGFRHPRVRAIAPRRYDCRRGRRSRRSNGRTTPRRALADRISLRQGGPDLPASAS